MKKVIIMALILAPLSLFAQQKFGHFDSSVIVQAMPEYKTSQTELQTLSKQYEDELTRMRDELQKMLRTMPGVEKVSDEHIQFGGTGVTVVTFD